jgi:hypothetical protein
MRITRALCSFSIFCGLLYPAAGQQLAPLPPDPLELVSGSARLLTRRQDRADASGMFDRARQNYNLHAPGNSPFVLKVSFSSSGQSQVEGDGTMEETWTAGSSWRWTAKMAGSTHERLIKAGQVYGTTDPVPLRVQMVRGLIFWPMVGAPMRGSVRSAMVTYQEKEIQCLLLSLGAPDSGASRYWTETEYCLDPASALLQVWSAAPGIYATYDYHDALNFHGHVMPRKISVTEDGSEILRIRIESLEDANDVGPKIFEPTPEMLARGPSFALSAPSRFPIRVDSESGATAWIQPVIVHATIGDEDGQVIEAEALQTSHRELADAAVDLVRNSAFPPTGLQREVFVNVQFYRGENDAEAVFLRNVQRQVVLKRKTVIRPRARREPRMGHPFAAQAGDQF